MAYIIVPKPGQVAAAVPLKDGFKAGRSTNNDLVLNDELVSRHHLQFFMSEHGWSVRNLSRTKPTWVNEVEIDTRVLRDNDGIQLGNVRLTYREADEPHQIVHEQVTGTSPPAHRDGDDRRLRLIYDMTRAVGALGNADELLGRMLDAILEVLSCERAMAGLVENDGSDLRRVVRVRGSLRDDIVVSRKVLDATMARGQAIILRNADGNETLVKEGILSAMAVPLQVGSRLFGFLYLDDRVHANRFSPQDLDFLTALGHLTAAALDSADRFRRVIALAKTLGADSPTSELVGTSAPMQKVKDQIKKFSTAHRTNVLIRGETGTGKELVARALHAASPRADKPFVTVNCAAIPETMTESELFGHVKGAFTGANSDKPGKFAQADRGTLFLDEIGDLEIGAQAKLLRAIEEGEIQPLGSVKNLRVNVRIISATHKDLRQLIAEKLFREDLYYRIAVAQIEMPPLRSREEDIELLAQWLLHSKASVMKKRFQGFTEAALAALRRYSWPGNVRELRNEMELVAISAESAVVDVCELSHKLRCAEAEPPSSKPDATFAERPSQLEPAEHQPNESGSHAAEPPRSELNATLAERFSQLERTEKELVLDAYHTARCNLSRAARLLGITRVMMKLRMDRYSLWDK